MHIRPDATIAVAILLAGIAASVWTHIDRRETQPASETDRLLAALGSSERSALQQCLENVGIIQDVHWAAACMANAAEVNAKRAECLREEPPPGATAALGPCETALEPADDSSECTLPDARAFPLNAARAAAEDRCLKEAAAVERTAGVDRRPVPQ